MTEVEISPKFRGLSYLLQPLLKRHHFLICYPIFFCKFSTKQRGIHIILSGVLPNAFWAEIGIAVFAAILAGIIGAHIHAFDAATFFPLVPVFPCLYPVPCQFLNQFPVNTGIMGNAAAR